MYFGTKSYLKNNRYHTAKHTLIVLWIAFLKKIRLSTEINTIFNMDCFKKKIKLPIEINTIFKI